MQNKLIILLVDDDPALTEIHSTLLEKNNYTCLTASDGVQAMTILDDYHHNIGVIISDISMPNMDGYEFCSHVKKNKKTRNIPVIFVSALNSLEEKLKGYEVGADDYIAKPVNDEELRIKITTLLDLREKQNLLCARFAESHHIAIEAMTLSSELGKIIEFYKQLLIHDDYHEISKYYFDAISAFNLVCILQIHTQDGAINISSSGIFSPLEENVILLARNKGHFFDFGARTIINYDNFALLIKNMPMDDKEKCLHIKDILGMLGEGLDVKINQSNHIGVTGEK